MTKSLFVLLFGVSAQAGELHAVRAGETIESIAEGLGDLGLADEIRRQSGLGPDEQPLVGTLLTIPVDSQSVVQQSAWVVSARGSVYTRTGGGERMPVELCTELQGDYRVCTGPDGSATVRLARAYKGGDYDTVSLFPNSCLTVRSTYASRSVRTSVVELTQGHLSVAKSKGEGGSVSVQTRDGLTTGTSGGYRVSVESAATRTEAVDARVAVAGGGVEVEVAVGQGTRVREGQVPDEPVDLLLPPVLLVPLQEAELRRFDFEWTEPELALGSRIELAVDPDFAELLYVEDVDSGYHSPELLFLPLGVPSLYWRVSAFDRMGFQGMPSESRSLRFPAGAVP